MVRSLEKSLHYGKHSIFYKLILTYLCITLPLSILFATFYQYSLQAMKRQTASYFAAQSEYFLNQWDSEINNIQNMMQYYLQEDRVQMISQIPQALPYYEQVYEMNQIEKSLVSIQYSSQYVQNASLFIPAVQKSISSTEGIAPLNQAVFRQVEQELRTSPDGFIKITPIRGGGVNNLFVGLSSPIAYSHSDLPVHYIILTQLSVDAIQEDLATFCATEHTIVYLYNKRAHYAIGSSSQPPQNFQPDLSSDSSDSSVITCNGQSYQRLVHTNTNSNFQLISYVPLDELYSFMPIFKNFAIFYCLLCILLIAAFSFGLFRMIKRPIDRLIRQFQGDAYGNLSLCTDYTKQDEFQSLYQSYNAMVERIHLLINQIYVQQLLTQKAELKQLQSQINPHFLYNSFFTLSLLARSGDMEQVSNFSSRLGEYFQYITRNAAEEVPLRLERDHALRYTQIQQIRFSNRLSIQVDPLPAEFENIPVPRLILQPLLENAFVHGIEKKTSGARLAVHWEAETPCGVRIIVEDNGTPPTPESLEQLNEKLSSADPRLETTALINIHRRLKFRYQNQSGLEASQSSLGGWKITVHIISGKGE